MSRAERIFDKLSRKGVKDERAYTLAGVGLADERSMRAYQEEMRAFERLCLSLQDEDGMTRLGVTRMAFTANDN
jgi:hypothetical protein